MKMNVTVIISFLLISLAACKTVSNADTSAVQSAKTNKKTAGMPLGDFKAVSKNPEWLGKEPIGKGELLFVKWVTRTEDGSIGRGSSRYYVADGSSFTLIKDYVSGPITGANLKPSNRTRSKAQVKFESDLTSKLVKELSLKSTDIVTEALGAADVTTYFDIYPIDRKNNSGNRVQSLLIRQSIVATLAATKTARLLSLMKYEELFSVSTLRQKNIEFFPAEQPQSREAIEALRIGYDILDENEKIRLEAASRKMPDGFAEYDLDGLRAASTLFSIE